MNYAPARFTGHAPETALSAPAPTDAYCCAIAEKRSYRRAAWRYAHEHEPPTLTPARFAHGAPSHAPSRRVQAARSLAACFARPLPRTAARLGRANRPRA